MLDTFTRQDGVDTVAALDGPLTVWHSTVHNWPKWHASWLCPGLEHARDMDSREFTDLVEVGTDSAGRPCRMCLLEPVLTYTLTRTDEQADLAFVTFSAQPVPDEAKRSYKYTTASSSSIARLDRVAAATGISLAAAVVGPVGFGWFSATSRAVLARNLRTMELSADVVGAAATLPDPAMVAIAWSLWNDDPPETADNGDTRAFKVRSGWSLAKLLAATS